MINLKKPIVWTIAGSDSSGGAGIQADTLTIHDLGGHACSLVTAVTAQNSIKLHGVGALSAADIADQWLALIKDMPPAAIKIGMLANEEQLVFIAQQLANLRGQGCGVPVVWDPVLSASVGGVLSPFGAQQLAYLAPYTDVVTPNISELSALTNIAIRCDQDIDCAVAVLFELGCKAVLVKGGHRHWAVEVEDRLYTHQEHWRLTTDRIDTVHGHGTGCCLSSALATALAMGFDEADATCVAKAYVYQGLKQATGVGQGSGPIAHLGWPTRRGDFPVTSNVARPIKSTMEGFPSLEKSNIGLYPVVDSVDWIARLLALGVTTLQLRIKQPMSVDVEQQIVDAIGLGRRYQAQVFINDHWEAAIRHGAYGIHLGQDDLAEANLQRIQEAGLRLGISTHGYVELLRILPLKPSYIALGHIFPTTTKDMPSKPQGLDKLALYQQLVGDIPTVAIGGINQQRVPSVKAKGVNGIAMVTAITEASDPVATTRGLLEMLNG